MKNNMTDKEIWDNIFMLYNKYRQPGDYNVIVNNLVISSVDNSFICHLLPEYKFKIVKDLKLFGESAYYLYLAINTQNSLLIKILKETLRDIKINITFDEVSFRSY